MRLMTRHTDWLGRLDRGLVIEGPSEPAGEPTHICCCDPGTALCGADVTGQSIRVVHPEASADPCAECVRLDRRGAKCSDPKCPGPGPVGA